MIAQASQDAFKELLSWMTTENGQIGIFDASNVTIARRAKLTELANQHSRRHEGCNISLVFIECIVTDEDVIHTLMRWKVRHSADFKGLSEPKAMEDLADRIRNYEKSYQTVREAEGAYIKIFDLKAKVHACNIFGRMAKSVLPYVLAIHQLNRPVFLLVVREKGGGGAEGGSAHDADLLPPVINPGLIKWASGYKRGSELLILTSTQPSALIHAAAVAQAAGSASPVHRTALAPIDRRALDFAEEQARLGLLPGMSAQDLDGVKPQVEGVNSPRRAKSLEPGIGVGRVDSAVGHESPLLSPVGGQPPPPEEALGSFKMTFGERLQDLVVRLEPLALEIEGSTSPVLIVAHEGAVRALRAFLLPEAARKDILTRELLDTSVTMSASQLLEYTKNDFAAYEEKVHALR